MSTTEPTTEPTLEPAIKIVNLRVTTGLESMTIDEFTNALRDVLNDLAYTKNVNVMSQSFLVDGTQVQKDSWFVEQAKEEDLSTLDEEQIQSRLDEMEQRIDAAVAEELDRTEVGAEISRYAFLLKKFAEGAPQYRDRALTLRARAMSWLA